MKICPKCNAHLSDDAKFCAKCGENLANVSPSVQNDQPVNASPDAPVSQGKQPDNSVSKNKKNIGIIAAMAVVLVAVIGIVLFVNRVHTINLDKYMKVTYEGYQGFGTATINFDKKAFNSDVEKVAKITKKQKASIESGLFDISDIINFSLKYDLDKKDHLSNSDTVKLTYKYDNDKLKQYKIRLEESKTEFKVEGLKEQTIIDAFDGVTVEFTGTSPKVRASLNTDSAPEDLHYELSESDNLKKDDEITVTVTDDEDSLAQNGRKVKETSKTFKVENVDSYVDKFADIPEDTLEKMKSQACDEIDAYTTDYSEDVKRSELKYEGCYFCSIKDPSDIGWYTANDCCMIYSATLTHKKKEFKQTKVYYPVMFNNVILYANKTGYVDVSDAEIKGSCYIGKSSYYTKGYSDADKMFNEIVASEKDDYTYEVDGDIAQITN